MRKGKKLLVLFLALNAVLSAYAKGDTAPAASHYDRMYNNIVKNVKLGKSNEKNYQTIEQILKQKNKELKDLHLQGDYIVKPEYLEWQVFFTGFYDEHGKGVDNSKENARYHTQVSGYYDEAGNYVVTGSSKGGLMGKTHQTLQKPKDINLGVNIPLRGLSREPVNLVLSGAPDLSFNPVFAAPNDPAKVITANVNVDTFSINIPVINIPEVPVISTFTVSVPSTGNGDDSFNSLGNASTSDPGGITSFVGNYNFSEGELSGIWNSQYITSYSYDNLTGTSNWVSGSNSMTNGGSAGLINVVGSVPALYEITGADRVTFGKDFTISMTSKVSDTYTGVLPHLIQYDPHGSRSTYHNYEYDYYGNSLTSWGTYDKYGELLNKGLIKGNGNSLLLISLQMHSGSYSPTVRNEGEIKGLYDEDFTEGGRRHVAFSFTVSGSTAARRLEFYNALGGLVELQTKESIGFNYANTSTAHLSIYNEGDVVLYGRNSVGVKTAGAGAGTLASSKLVLKTPIRINGDSSIGVELAQVMDSGYGNITAGQYDPQSAEIRVTVGDEKNKYAGNATGKDENYVEGAIGLYVNHASLNYRIKEYELSFGDYAKDSSLAYISKGTLTLDNDKYSVINIDKGIDNTGIIVDGTSSVLNLYPHITVGSTAVPVDGTIALIGKSVGKINLLGSNNIETNGKKSHGVVLTDTGTIMTGTSGGNHSFKTTGEGSATLYVKDAELNLGTSNNVDVYATGDKSIGVYNDHGTITLGTTGGTYAAGTNGVLLYNSGGGTINTAGTSFTAGDGSIFSIAKDSGTKTNFTSGSTLNLQSGSTGFIVDGSMGISGYFGTYYSGLNTNMDVVVSQDATLMALQNANSALSSLSFGSIGSIFKSITLNGGNIASLLEGTLTVDQNVNLNDSVDAYNTIEKSLIGITNNAVISGSLANQVAMADNFSSVSAVTYNNMVNNGTVSLSGDGSVAVYANNGNITNNNTISATGKESFGIYGENGTVTLNTANITVGDQGVGIYGVSYQDPSNPGANGGGLINITNSGTITGTGGSGTIGVYSNINKIGGTKGDAVVTLSGGTIDLGNVTGAIGVYVNKGTVNDSGSVITVGNNGIGIYAKDSDLTLNGTNINLHGNNTLGLYLEGDTNLLTGIGNIDVNGQNAVLFYMNTNPGATINNNFTVASTPGSTYTLGSMKGGSMEYTGDAGLASDGTLVTGENSAVYLNGSTIIAAPNAVNVAAIALNNQYSGTLPSGMTANTDGENNGIIILGDNSAGIYGKNGSRISNKGSITAGTGSAGLVTSGSGSFVLNSGSINTGAGSYGIYLKDGVNIDNMASGSITSTGAGSVGLFSNGNTGTVDNSGIIDLTGDKSIGIYSMGTNSQIINNNTGGEIKVGDSSNISDPSIGIYSSIAGSTVTNSGSVTSGTDSIGIYSVGGTVNNNGISNVGNAGIGIYSTNGTVNLNTGSVMNMGIDGAVAVYGISSAVNNSADLNIGEGNYGFILEDGSFINGTGTNSTVGKDSVYTYSTKGTMITNNGNVTMTGSNNVGFYMAQDPASGTGGAVMVNNGIISGTSGNNNVGIYNYGGTIDNYGTVAVGNSDILLVSGTTDVDVANSKYSVGIYGENAAIINHAGANITAGYGGYGIVAKGGTANNFGTITTNGDYSAGMYTENGVITNESTGVINVTGNNGIGMAGKGENSGIINHGTINITGNGAVGMYGNLGTVITNTGTINIYGDGQLFVSSDPVNPLHNVNSGAASVNGIFDNTVHSIGNLHALPELINAGIIKTTGVLALDGLQVMIKLDPSSVQPSTNPDYDFELSGTSIIADEILTSKPIVILPGFADGTIANVYKLEGVIQASSGKYDFISGSLLWEATPHATGNGSDIYMSRKSFTEFTDGLWFEDFGTSLENNFLNASGDGVEIYNKTAYIPNEENFRHIMASLAGNVYSNINQRENDIAGAFENSLHLLQDSKNNTKENVKISIIGGKGKNREETDGVTGYDYTATGVLALREVERTYRHTFGYSLGYLRTGFEFNDGNSSEEWVDTVQMGAHNKYEANGWEVRNDITGRASIHNVDRNIDWTSPLGRSEMNGTYETYSITSDNILGKEFKISKEASIMPYGAFKAMYVTRPTFSETGLEALEVEGNDAWSAKPRAGVELKGAVPLGKNSGVKLKGTLDVAYEYEFADLNERERAKLIAVENDYHKLSKPQEEKGTIRTKAALGVEVEDKYGIFITGEYFAGDNKENDYRAGVTLKAVF